MIRRTDLNEAVVTSTKSQTFRVALEIAAKVSLQSSISFLSSGVSLPCLIKRSSALTLDLISDRTSFNFRALVNNVVTSLCDLRTQFAASRYVAVLVSRLTLVVNPSKNFTDVGRNVRFSFGNQFFHIFMVIIKCFL